MSNEAITIQVNNKYLDDDTVFKIGRSTELSKLMRAYEQRHEINKNTFHFMFNGKRINENDTAEKLNIENGSDIYCKIPPNMNLVQYVLNNLCASEDLSISALRDKINFIGTFIGTSTIEKACNEEYPYLYRFFHLACLNKCITTEIISYLLTLFPKAAMSKICAGDDNILTYPLHRACYNENCSSSLIELLLKNFRGAIDYTIPRGAPLHIYLNRKTNIDIDMIKKLVEASSPDALFYQGDEMNTTPLHLSCQNSCVTLEVVNLIYNKWPYAIRKRDKFGYLPLHRLCTNEHLNDIASLDILRFLINIDPTLMREATGETMFLPIHLAVANKSTTFCKVLIDSYPESIQLTRFGSFPIHKACRRGSRDDKVETIAYMFKKYPESINARDSIGRLPIHCAAKCERADVIELLLKHDPDATRREGEHSQLPLHMACVCSVENLCVVRMLFDVYPEAIHILDDNGRSPLNLTKGNTSTEIFLNQQLFYIQQAAQDTTVLSTPDADGYLPLHRALLKGEASLGSIKLLVRGYPDAQQVADKNYGFLPLHMACWNASADIVHFLADECGLDVCDTNQDYPLHHACQTANLDVIKYLVESNPLVVSKTNVYNKLPFHMLVENEDDQLVENKDEQVRDRPEFTEACFLLLRAYPETVMMPSRKRNREQV